MAGNIQALVDIGERAYSNLYDVSISKTGIFDLDLTAIVEKVSFGGNQSLGTFYSEAMMQSFVDKVTRIKQVTLSFRETYDYKYFNAITKWQNSIYNFKGNYFTSGNPSGTIIVSLMSTRSDDTLLDHGIPLSFYINGAVPTDLTYPSYTYSSSEALVTDVTFTFDDVIFTT